MKTCFTLKTQCEEERKKCASYCQVFTMSLDKLTKTNKKSYLPSNAGIYILVFLVLLLLYFNISNTGIHLLNVLHSLSCLEFLVIHM